MQPRNSGSNRRSGSFDASVRESISESSQNKPERLSQNWRGFDISGSWVWEICGAVLSIVCISLMVGFLAYIDGMLYAGWQYSISPNTVIAVISAFTKASILAAISSCLGQLKWNKDEQKPLYHFQVLDQASRGPWGALEVFWTMKSGFAIAAAALTIMSLALDPFAQQILHFPSREVVMHNETAYVPRTQIYAPDMDSAFVYPQAGRRDTIMETALLTGLAGINVPLRPTCSTPRCKFPDFATMAMCGSCKDVTDRSTQDCQPISDPLFKEDFDNVMVGDDKDEDFSLVPANCTYSTPGGFRAAPEIVDVSRTYGDIVFMYQPFTSVANYTKDTLFSFSTFKYTEVLAYGPKNKSAIGPKPEINECSLYMCENLYTQNEYSSNGPELHPSGVVPLVIKASDLTPDADGIPPMPEHFTLTPKDGAHTFHNSSYYLGFEAKSDMRQMNFLFSTTYLGTARPCPYAESPSNSPGLRLGLTLFNRDNISDSVHRMAASMTDSMQSRTNHTRVSGEAFQANTFISVRWPWIVLPASLVVCSIVLLVAMMITTRGHPVLWKSSVLPLMIGRLETAPENDLTYERHLDSIQTTSKRIKLMIKDDRDQGLFKFSERQ
ncbi:unnamed protein product [Penicillium salamii]|nr:unnamed protein product [Penicillium salamii]CAG8336544.1 unnamed protein product [Penicillium salamii]